MKTPSPMNRFKLEKILWKRLKVLGYVLLGFSVLFLTYAFAIIFWEEDLDILPIQEESVTECHHVEEEPLAHETLNFFLIASVFVCVGTACLLTARKRNQS
ncbi:MAG: hypothetical protein K2Y01_02580 [Rhabdochlamydiaceae bacterium]|nr:hypothetical protein [Rhabdochlamydiaceae bacterium]